MIHPDAVRFVQLYNYGKNSGAGIAVERLTALYFEMSNVYNMYTNYFADLKSTMDRGTRHG